MNKIHYISSEKNVDFVNQRKKALITSSNIELIDVDLLDDYTDIKKIYFFTMCKKSLQTFYKLSNVNKNIYEAINLNSIHAAVYYGSTRFKNKYYFWLYELFLLIKNKVKIFIFSNYKILILGKKIYTKYILVSTHDETVFKKSELWNNKFIQCKLIWSKFDWKKFKFT